MPPSEHFPTQGFIRWRMALAGGTLVAALAAAVWAFYSGAGAGEFGTLVLIGLAISRVLPLLLLGLLSVVIARGLARSLVRTTGATLALDWLIPVVSVLLLAIAFAPLALAARAALHEAAMMRESALVWLCRRVSIYAVIPLLSVGALLLLIAVGIGRTPRSALKLALIQDVLVLVVAIGGVVPALPDPSHSFLHALGVIAGSSRWLWTLLALAFGADAAYVLRAVWRWRPAWAVFGIVSAGLLSAGMVTSAVRPPPVAREARAPRDDARLGNLKSLALAVQMYAVDNDRLPDMQDLATVIAALVDDYVTDESFFHRPDTGSAYGVNSSVSGKALADIEDSSRAVIFYETEPDSRGQRGAAFADGHARLLSESEWVELKSASGIE